MGTKSDDQRPDQTPPSRFALPDPKTLKAYRDIDPEFPKLLATLLQKQVEHRHQQERAEEATARTGMFYGLLISLGGLGIAWYIVSMGATAVGGTVATADLLGLVSVFIYGSRRTSLPRHPFASNARRAKNVSHGTVPSTLAASNGKLKRFSVGGNDDRFRGNADSANAESSATE